jgi:hypothetical protein
LRSLLKIDYLPHPPHNFYEILNTIPQRRTKL